MTYLSRAVSLLLLLTASASCAPPPFEAPFAPAPTRGVVLISLDTLRADYVFPYGAPREASPFFAELADRGVVFRHALAPYPATLVSHMSIFTGLYPREHGVYPPNTRLAGAIPTLPEVLQAAGFRTAGFTEGGFVAGGYGFQRGFEVWEDPSYQDDTDIERTFARGLAFLRGLDAGERFFLFLHTYSPHDPYAPPPPWPAGLEPVDPASVERSSGESLRRSNLGLAPIDRAAVADFERLYRASVLYVDRVLRGFFAELERLGLSDEATVIVTSDHGEEFLEHGKLAHTQLYPEGLFVPLVVLHPEAVGGGWVDDLVELVDLAPTICALAGVEAPPGLSGRSLLPYLGAPSHSDPRDGYAEVRDQEENRSLVTRHDGDLYQFHLVQHLADPEGAWVSRAASFDVAESPLVFRGRSYHRPRSVRVRSGEATVAVLELGVDWASYSVDFPLGGARTRLALETDGCDSPRQVEEAEDGRCLSFIVQGPALARTELFNLSRDPLAQRDLSLELPDLHRRLARRLAALEFTPRAEAAAVPLSDEHAETLRALGYLD